MPPALHKDKGVDRHRPVRQDCSPFDFLAQCKASSAPEVEVGKFWNALKGLGIKEAWVIASIKETYPIENGVSVANLFDFLAKMESSIERPN